MTLRALHLTGFRNLRDAVLDFPSEGVALVGANAQGKSNLLESIHYLEIFRSARGSRDTQLIRFGETHFRVEGRLTGRGASSVAAAVQRPGPVKRVSVDGTSPPRLGDALGKVASVLFTPEDARLVAQGPDERRRFLDIVLSVNLPGYLAALLRYRQILGQRNAALRDRAPAATVAAWDPLLAESGGQVARARARWAAQHEAGFRDLVAEISGGEWGGLGYRSGIPEVRGLTPDDAAGWVSAFLSGLESTAEGERRRGVTLVGPHRDDLLLTGAPEQEDPTAPPAVVRDLRDFGSGGQKRTAALALRLLEAETLRERRGVAPILLLDDVFAELDGARSERILPLLERTAGAQVILTAPKEADIRFRRDRLAPWTVQGGAIQGSAGEGS